MNSISVLHIINGEFHSGAERVQDILALKLPEFGYKVSFACLKPNLFPNNRISVQSPLYNFPMKTKYDISIGVPIYKLIKKNNFRIIHTHTPRSAMIGRFVSIVAGVPMLHHIHSPTSIDTESWMRNKVNAFVENQSISRSRQLIVVSESLKDRFIEQGNKPERIVVAPNGVPTPALFSERPRPTDKWTIGVVALFRHRKGLEVLLESLLMLDKSNYNFCLRVIGPFETKEYENNIRDRISTFGLQDKIHLIGFTNNVDAELVKLDIFVLPSIFGEGMPMVILEAMSHGLPIVCTKVEGIPEVVRDGREGLLVPPGDPKSLANAIKKIMDGTVSWKKMRTNAYQRQVQNYSDISMARRVARVYDQVLR
jgi:glycosyltransferase involved in cell wall biosynthesis